MLQGGLVSVLKKEQSGIAQDLPLPFHIELLAD